MKECKGCGREFAGHRADVKFCSRYCRSRMGKGVFEPRPQRACAICGMDISNLSLRSKFCSSRCRARDTNARRNDHRDARAKRLGLPFEKYSRRDIFARYGGTCAYCDAPAEHIDHVVPISKGGADAPHNLLPACAPCNLGKSAKSLAEWAATF